MLQFAILFQFHTKVFNTKDIISFYEEVEFLNTAMNFRDF